MIRYPITQTCTQNCFICCVLVILQYSSYEREPQYVSNSRGTAVPEPKDMMVGEQTPNDAIDSSFTRSSGCSKGEIKDPTWIKAGDEF